MFPAGNKEVDGFFSRIPIITRDTREYCHEHEAWLIEEANKEKEKGNNFFRNKEYEKAIACYTKAMNAIPQPMYYVKKSENGKWDELGLKALFLIVIFAPCCKTRISSSF